MVWKLQTYVDEDGDRILASWYASLSHAEKARFQVRTWHLLHQPRDGWNRPQFDTLHDDAAGFGEIIMGAVGGLATRLVGYFNGDAFCVVLVVTKKDKKYDPSNWEKQINERKLKIEADSRRASEWIPKAPLEESHE